MISTPARSNATSFAKANKTLHDTLTASILNVQNQVTRLREDFAFLDQTTNDPSTPSLVTAASIGLGLVNNTTDLNKPISSSTQTALNAKVDSTLYSPNIQYLNINSPLTTLLEAKQNRIIGNLSVEGYLPSSSVEGLITHLGNKHPLITPTNTLAPECVTDLNAILQGKQQAIEALGTKTSYISTVGQSTLIGYTTVCGEIVNTGLLKQEGNIVFEGNFLNYNTGINILQSEFQSLRGVTTTSGSTIQSQLNAKESSTSSGINVTRLANGTVGNIPFQYINSLTSNCQNQINTKADLTANNNFSGNINTFKEVDIASGSMLWLKSNASMYIVGNTTDTQNVIQIDSGNIDLSKGFIKGRADGFNYANNSYDTYTGYCYNLVSTPIAAIHNTIVSLNGIRTLPPGVYLISGAFYLTKGTATYNANTSLDIGWSATGGNVPATSIRLTVAATNVGNLRCALPTTYFIVTGSGILKPQYSYPFASVGTSTVYFDISIVRIA